jgi:hypothetical protein
LLASNGGWREALEMPTLEEGLENARLQYVVEQQAERIEKLKVRNRRLNGSRKALAAGAASGSAIEALVAIMSDPAINVRRRLQAAENLLLIQGAGRRNRRGEVVFVFGIFGR